MVVPPWAAQMRRLDDGTAGQGPADDRPVEAIAAEIARATPEQDQGDDNTPPDPDEGLRRFVEAVMAAGTRDRDGGWLGGIREYIPDSGAVPSSRFLRTHAPAVTHGHALHKAQYTERDAAESSANDAVSAHSDTGEAVRLWEPNPEPTTTACRRG